MRFSDAFLRQLRDRVSLAEYAGRKLAWDKRKSRPAASDYWACCPFHQEKSPSFHVLDAKGIYKCFGCGEKGDVFTLAMKLEGLNFPEAVSRMADLAGMEMPRDEYEDRGEADRRKRLYTLVARAGRLYGEALLGREGAEARAYLERRGIGPEIWDRFGIGYAPGGWTWSIDRLKAEGFSLDEVAAAGLAYPGDEGRRPTDVFRDRVTFAIADSGGKLVAFGGRALKAEEKAKYINSPETALFHKGRTLYRLKQARETLAKTKASGLVVGEGYLDVVAFERAGIAAVAPLGTALTEEQLQLLWRAGGEPILCFDGDSAGARAADRALELALAHLGPGRSVRIALLPPGEDPDDLYRRAGAEALVGVLAAARPAVEALFDREKSRQPLTTPEARAGFKANLRAAAARIADSDTKRFYLSELLSRADALMRAAWTGRGRGAPRDGAFAAPTPELKARAAASLPAQAAEQFLRAAVDYPRILAAYGDWIDRLSISDPDLGAIRNALITLSHADSGQELGAEDASPAIDRAGLSLHLLQSGEERAAARLSAWPKARADASSIAGPRSEGGANSEEVETEWLAMVTREVVLPAIREEMAELRAQADSGDSEAFARFQALGREARELEVRAREARIFESGRDDAPDDMVA